MLVIAAIIYWIKFAPVRVVASRVEPGSIVAEVMGTGTLEARVEATVSPKISGRIAQLLTDQGDRVSAGDLLVRLADDELKQQVEIAQADVEAAAAAIDRLMTDKNRAKAVYAQADKSNLRAKTLAEQNAVSQDDVDKATESLAVAEAGVSRAEAAIAEGQKQLIAAEKTLEYHRARLAGHRNRRPFRRLIVNRERDPGDVVVPGSSILTLIATDEMWISAWVDETEMARLAENQRLESCFDPNRNAPIPERWLAWAGKLTARHGNSSSMCGCSSCRRTGRSDSGPKRSLKSSGKSRCSCCRRRWSCIEIAKLESLLRSMAWPPGRL